jgi:hypothetical protein
MLHGLQEVHHLRSNAACEDGRAPQPSRGRTWRMFLFFSNRLGCIGSLLVSIVVTVVLVLIFF